VKKRRWIKDKRTLVYVNLERACTNTVAVDLREHQEWGEIVNNVKRIVDGDWQVKTNRESQSLCCIYVHETEYDGQKGVTEILVTNTPNEIVDETLKHHRRNVSIPNAITKIESITEKVRTIIEFVNKSHICSGFLKDDQTFI